MAGNFPIDKIEHKPIVRSAKLAEWQAGLAAFIAYSLLTCAVTFPFVLQLGRSVIEANGDSYQNLWYMWWYKEALFSGQDPARTHLMYGLLPSVQVLVSSIYNALWLIPFEFLLGPLFAFNLGIFVSFPLAGLWTYFLAGEFTKNRLAAFLAGFCYAFSTYHFYRAEGHLGLVTVQWLPFYAWRMFVLRRNSGWRNSLLAALGLVLCGLSDLYYLGYFVLPFTAFFLIWCLVVERSSFFTRQNFIYFGTALGLGFILLVPFYSPFFHLDPDVAQAVGVRAGESKDLSADLLSFFLPDARNPLFGKYTAPVYDKFGALFPVEEGVFPGIVLLIAGLTAPFITRFRRPDSYFWLSLTAGSFLLALGPRLHVGGKEFNFPLPYALLYGKLPFLSSFRAPNRFGLATALGLSVLAALSLSFFFEKLKGLYLHPANLKRKSSALKAFMVSGIAAGLIMVSTILSNLVYSWPLPLAEAQVPEIYRQIGAEKADFLVLELPLAPLSAPLYYQTVHQKPLVGGYPSRISNRMSLSFDKVPYLGMFNPAESSGVMEGEAAKGQPDIFQIDITFNQALQENNIRYVVLRDYPGGRRFFRWMAPYLEANLGVPYFKNTTNSLLAWKVDRNRTAVPPVEPGKYRFRLGEGWNAGLGKSADGELLRLVEQDGQIEVDSGTAEKASLKLRITPYIRPQTIEVRLNGNPVGKLTASTQWKAENFTLPELNLNQGRNIIEMHSVEGCLIASDFIPNSPDHRCISFAVQNVIMLK